MIRRISKPTAFIIIVLMLAGASTPLAAAVNLNGHELSSQGAIVIDFDTGTELFTLNSDVHRVPASTIKVLAVLAVYDAIKAGKSGLNSKSSISAGVAAFSTDRTWSNVPLAEGSSYTVQELLEVVMIRSACAATVALGEAVFGSEKLLITRMQEIAADLGVPVKIHDSWGGSPNNMISPAGLAIITRKLIMEYPEVLNITSKRTVTFNGASFGTSNLLLGEYEGLDGFKTGFTNPAGYCFIGTAVRDGRRLISVTMGSTLTSRYPDTRAMLDYGFSVADGMIVVPEPPELPEPPANPETPIYEFRAEPSAANLIINGEVMPLPAYLIDDYHYFKLRDVAYLLNGTEKQFGVSYDAVTSTGILISGLPYESEGGELNDIENSRPYARSNTIIIINGYLCDFEIYIIDDNNYFRLRDLAELFDFSAVWIDETRTVVIETVYGWTG